MKPRWWIEQTPDLGTDGFGGEWLMRVEWTVDGQQYAAIQPITHELAEDTASHRALAALIAERHTPD